MSGQQSDTTGTIDPTSGAPVAGEVQESTSTDAGAGVVEETAPSTLADIVGSAPTDDEYVIPRSGEAAPADPGPTGDVEGGVAVEEEIKEPWQRSEDGKWTDGKYVGKTLGELFVEVKKGQRNAEKLVGKKAEQAADPFLREPDGAAIDEGEDDAQYFDEGAFGDSVGKAITEALTAAGVVPTAPQDQQQGVTPEQAQLVYGAAQSAIDSPHTTDEQFREVLAALVMVDPEDTRSRQAVLNDWAQRGPEASVAAAQESTRIELAYHQFAQQVQQLQQTNQLTEQQQREAIETAAATQAQTAGAAEDQYAQQHVATDNPGWDQYAEPLDKWLQANQWMLDAARNQPVYSESNPADRPRARAVAAVLQQGLAAVGYAKPVAGFGGGVSEQGTNMGAVTGNQHQQPTAQQQIAHQRGLAQLETGGVADDMALRVANQNPPGLAETSFKDLVGFDTVAN